MKKALIVGINSYPVSPLQGCINDASELADILESNGDNSPNFYKININLRLMEGNKCKVPEYPVFQGAYLEGALACRIARMKGIEDPKECDRSTWKRMGVKSNK